MVPKISVIVPVYNVEEYLEECLDSIFEQTLSPIEVICVDDGSTDSSPEILKRYAEKYENLRVIRKENGGLSSARNAGLDAAQGEYLLYIDSDDWLTAPDAAQALYARAAAEELDLLFFSAEVFYENEAARVASEIPPRYYQRKGNYPSMMTGPALFEAFCKNRDFRASSCLICYRRAFLKANDLRFDEGLLHEDEISTPECLALAERAAYLPAPYYGRRVRGNSIMTSNGNLRRAHAYCVVARHLADFSRARLTDERFRRCFRKHMLDRVYLAGALWISAAPSERRDFLRALPPAERAAFRRDLCIGVPRARIRRLRRALRSAAKK